MNGAEITMERLSRHFRRLRRSGDGWVGLCPHHNDRSPSLSVGIGNNGRLLLKCFVGCSFAEIIKAAGLCADDLGGLTAPPRQSPEELRARARHIWEETRPIAGTVAEAYLRNRGIEIVVPALRFSRLRSTELPELAFPAVVADPVD
jgi:hypothetical protein